MSYIAERQIGPPSRCCNRYSPACLSLSDNELSAEINSQKAQVPTLLRRVGHALSTHVSICNARTCLYCVARKRSNAAADFDKSLLQTRECVFRAITIVFFFLASLFYFRFTR